LTDLREVAGHFDGQIDRLADDDFEPVLEERAQCRGLVEIRRGAGIHRHFQSVIHTRLQPGDHASAKHGAGRRFEKDVTGRDADGIAPLVAHQTVERVIGRRWIRGREGWEEQDQAGENRADEPGRDPCFSIRHEGGKAQGRRFRGCQGAVAATTSA
jgi:hypothetical protein